MSHNKRIILAGVIVFAVFAYMHASQKETQAQEPLVVPDAASSSAGTNQTGRQILALLADLKSVQLDDSIFSDPMFQALQDTSVELILEPKGRPNPFAPLGKDAVLDESQGVAASSPGDVPFGSESGTSTAKSKKTGAL